MSVVRINALTVPPEAGAELERRFEARAREVDDVDGFEEFALLRPTDGSDRYLVYTRWETAEAFDAWVASDAFQRGHAHGGPGEGGGGHDAHGSGEANGGGGPAEGHAHGHGHGEGRPAASSAHLWSFDVVLESRRD